MRPAAAPRRVDSKVSNTVNPAEFPQLKAFVKKGTVFSLKREEIEETD